MASILKVNTIQDATNSNTAVTINSSGLVAPKKPAFQATLSANQTVTDNSNTKINFNTVTFDTSSSFDTSNYRYVAPVAGYYWFSLNLYLATSSVDINRFILYIGKNGSISSPARVHDEDLYDNTQNAYQVRQGGIMYELNGSSDYVEGWTYIDTVSGDGTINNDHTKFEGFLVSAT
jgi:hypothetical protein|tara:strand:+ start:32 stop:562 length:531 start_codon:yes stop_codon:yes gene_type:complete